MVREQDNPNQERNVCANKKAAAFALSYINNMIKQIS